MARDALPDVPFESAPDGDAAMQHGPWRKRGDLASGLRGIESFLARAGFARVPWLVAAFAAAIGAWFALPAPGWWAALMLACTGVATAALLVLRGDGAFPFLRQALAALALALALGCGHVWVKSALVGAPPIARPQAADLTGTVLSHQEQPAEGRVRLLLATRDPESGRAIKARLNVPLKLDRPELRQGAQIRLRARLVPPAPPMLPGGYDFARAAWFQGIAATGAALGEVQVLRAAPPGGGLEDVQRALSAHVRAQLPGSTGAIAAAYASGDRGAIPEADEEAMRNSGLAHLLSISGLHVSAVIAAVYVVVLKLGALWPWLALRVRLPPAAAAGGALAGIGYTLLTGAEVPTVRSCIAALLVLIARALGREALSLWMVAVAAFVVLLFWPEAVVGPSFQMSFAAVIAIVALSGTAPVRDFLAPREEGWLVRSLRNLAMLLLTGVVIELALMPIGLFHFHQSGVYGALANVVAIPLTTFVSMPLIALALLLDAFGLGAPVWWLAGKSLDALLTLAHFTASQPGAVSTMPAMGRGAFLLFVAGGLWLALWNGRVRLWGLVPAGIGAFSLATLTPPDLLVSGDGRHVGLTGELPGELLVLREGREGYARDTLLELAGMSGAPRSLDQWPGARCNADLCVVQLRRGGRDWQVLMTRTRDRLPERELAAACERVDLVISDRWLPRSCRPRWLKADRRYLERSGGLAIDLADRSVVSVADSQGDHGWWVGPAPYRPRPTQPNQ
ncbi:MAG: ComEC/Rec2 family competence protein [Novosphingobium sp.]